MNEAAAYRVRGVNDERDTCEHCGKTGLKKVAWLESLDAEGNGTGEMMHVGTTCAAKLCRPPHARRMTRTESLRYCENAALETAEAERIRILKTECVLVELWGIYRHKSTSLAAVAAEMAEEQGRHPSLVDWQNRVVELRRAACGV